MDCASARADGVWMGVSAGWKGLSRPRCGPGDAGCERVVRSYGEKTYTTIWVRNRWINQMSVRLLTLLIASMSSRSGAGMLRVRGVFGVMPGCMSYGTCVGEGGPLWAESVRYWVRRWVVPCECTMWLACTANGLSLAPPTAPSAPPSPTVSKDSSEWACLMLSITRRRPRSSTSLSITSTHVQRPRLYGSPGPWSKRTTRKRDAPPASSELCFLAVTGVVGWLELCCIWRERFWRRDGPLDRIWVGDALWLPGLLPWAGVLAEGGVALWVPGLRSSAAWFSPEPWL